jgi:hypothetical protein
MLTSNCMCRPYIDTNNSWILSIFFEIFSEFSQVIKSQNKIIYTVVSFKRFKHLYSLKIIKMSKINNMRRAIKICKHNIIVTDAPLIRLNFPYVVIVSPGLNVYRACAYEILSSGSSLVCLQS